MGGGTGTPDSRKKINFNFKKEFRNSFVFFLALALIFFALAIVTDNTELLSVFFKTSKLGVSSFCYLVASLSGLCFLLSFISYIFCCHEQS